MERRGRREALEMHRLSSSALMFLLFVFFSLSEPVVTGVMIPARFDGFVYKDRAATTDSIMIEAFFDPVCPDSRDSWPPLKQALDHYGGHRVSLILHPFALPASRLASKDPTMATAMTSSTTASSSSTTSSSQSRSNSSSSQISPITILSNICNLVTIRLDSTNYIAWKYQISTILRAYDLFGYIDGSKICPDPTIVSEESGSTSTVNVSVNPDYLRWIAQDQGLMTLIHATLTPNALGFVIGCKKAKEVWECLERRFASMTRANILQLKTELQTINKGSDSVDVYVQRIKAIKDKLATVSIEVDDEDLLLYTLNGLNIFFN